MPRDLKEEINREMKKEGNLRGGGILSVLAYIREEKGDDGIKAIEKKLEEIGYPLKAGEIRTNNLYSNGFLTAIFILCQELFGWDEQDIFRMGNAAPQLSSINKILTRHFLSIKILIGNARNHWQKYFDFGEVDIVELNEKEKHLVLRIKNFDCLPIYCVFLAGYMKRLVQFTAQGVGIEETGCIHRGDSCHEYRITWK